VGKKKESKQTETHKQVTRIFQSASPAGKTKNDGKKQTKS
jgi:hypothetical protein